MSSELAAILLIGAVHVAAFAVLVWLMLDGDRTELRGWWPRDDDPGPTPKPAPAPGDRALPLPGAAPAAVRLRGPAGPLARPARRRGDHAPAPGRTRDPV